MREAVGRDDFIIMSPSRPRMESEPAHPAPHAPPPAPSAEQFEYCRISDEWGIVRLLARVHDELGVPSDPLLLVTSVARPGVGPTLPQLVAPRSVATERQLGSPTLTWLADFAVRTELVERFEAAFALHDGPVRWLDLPAPVLRVGAARPGSLLVARPPRAARPATRRRRRTAALAASAAALGTAATPAAAVAATGPTSPRASATTTRARVAVTTTTSAAAPAGMASASSVPAAATTKVPADPPASGTAATDITTTATATTPAATATTTRGATTATTGAPPRSTTATVRAGASGDPVATDATATTTTRVAATTKTTTASATQSAAASTRGTARRSAGATTTAATLTADPRALATRRCAPRASATLAGTSGQAAGIAASSLASPVSSASDAGSPPPARAADGACVAHPSASPRRHDEHAGATAPRRSGVAAVWLSPSTPAGHAAAQRRRAERAAARARATAHEATAVQLAAGLAVAARRAEHAQRVHEADARRAAASTAPATTTTTAGGQTTTSTPGYSGPTSWTGSVAADPGLTGVVRNLAGLLTDGNRPPSFLIPIYIAAGRRYHVPWQVLAAINSVETDYGRDLNTSGAGAVGWMQFMPGTWREYGVAADGASVPNPYDPRDAIFAAARYLAANGARNDLHGAIYAYNHADWYVSEVLSRAQAIASEPQYEQASVSRRGSVSVQFAVDRPHPARITYGSGFLSHFDRLIAAANMVSAADFPYRWGGGHEQPARFGPFDCSGSVSYVMQQAGYEIPTTVSGQIGAWGLPHGPGRVTIFYNAVHTFMRIGNRYFGTSGFARPGGGAGWFDVDRLPAAYLAAFDEVHVPDLGPDSFAADPQLTFRARPGLLRARARLASLSALRVFGHERLSALAIHRALAHPLRSSVSLPPR